LTDGQLHELSLYFLDWDTTARSEQVELTNAVTGAVLDTETVSSFHGGVYLELPISGNVTITITRLTGPSAVLSGLFLDLPPVSAALVNKDTTTQGNWMWTYGRQGFDYVGYSSLPSYATVTMSNSAAYTWTSTTTDPRALETYNVAGRTASCWFSATAFSVNVNLTDHKFHYLALYFLDWDTWARNEQVQVRDAATGTVLDTETLSSFHGGIYLVWQISGNVVIQITRLGGANAVLSGVFLSAPT
jgi:hypothetical protein